MSRTVATFKRLSPAYKAIVALVAPLGTIIGTLLALNVISPFGEDALAAGVKRTTEAATASLNLRYESTPRSGPAVAFAAAGEFDFRAGRGELRYDFSDADLQGVDVRFADRDVYIKLPGAGDWVHADLDTAREQIADYAEAAGLEEPPATLASIQDLGLNDPSQVLAHLRRAGAVEELGEETIFGVATTRYRAAVEPREAGEQRLTVTAWIDDSSLIRRLELTAPAGPSPFTMRMDFTEFGKRVDVPAPAPENVQELDELLDRILARS